MLIAIEYLGSPRVLQRMFNGYCERGSSSPSLQGQAEDQQQHDKRLSDNKNGSNRI